MKVIELLEGYSDKELIKMAKGIGEKMYGNSHSGLVFHPSVKRQSYADYADSSDAGPTVDTYDYVFFPSTGKGMEAADQELEKKHVDKDGKIYIAGSNGVLILSKPFKNAKVELPLEEIERFKNVVLKHFPTATFTMLDKWYRIFAHVGDEMVGQFHAKNDRKGNKPGWLVHDHESHNW